MLPHRISLPLMLVVVLSAALIAVITLWPTTPPAHHKPVPLPKGGDFVLNTRDGVLKLADLRGQVVLLYFGYRLCPDICPTNLAGIARAFELLNSEELAQVEGIFISLDPARDSLDDLYTYATYFHPRIHGATATPQTLSTVAAQYGVTWKKVETTSALGYMLDHSAYTYLIAPDGRMSERLDHATPPDLIAQKIRVLLTK